MTEAPFTPQPEPQLTPMITVAMPVFNGGTHLKLAVLSILAQTFRNWELLIIDDGSTDNSLQDIASINDARIRVFRDGKNKGLAARLNEAIDLARGQYFARMDHDDVSYPERFTHQLALLERNPKLDVVAVRAITISEDNMLVGNLPCSLSHAKICARPWQGFYFPHPTWMGKTAWFRMHRYTLPGPYFCEDQELLLRSYTHSQFATVDRILFAYRVRDRAHWRKHTLRRWAFFQIQWRFFLHSKQFHLAFLTLAVFAGRIVKDFFSVIRQTLGGAQYRRTSLGRVDLAEWQDVLQHLT